MAPQTNTPSDIRALLDEVNTAGRDFLDGAAGQLPNGRLIAAARNLIAGLQDPVEAVLESAWQVGLAAPSSRC